MRLLSSDSYAPIRWWRLRTATDERRAPRTSGIAQVIAYPETKARARAGHPADADASADESYGRWDAVFACLAIGTGAFILYLGRSLTFWFDEWRWITFEGGPGD